MTLFEPLRLGDIDLNNRIVMAPMTRSRAGQNDEPTQLTINYYAQRASAGLIITEGVYPSYDGKGYVRTPGIVSAEQIAAWEKVCHKVHEMMAKSLCKSCIADALRRQRINQSMRAHLPRPQYMQPVKCIPILTVWLSMMYR